MLFESNHYDVHLRNTVSLLGSRLPAYLLPEVGGLLASVTYRLRICYEIDSPDPFVGIPLKCNPTEMHPHKLHPIAHIVPRYPQLHTPAGPLPCRQMQCMG